MNGFFSGLSNKQDTNSHRITMSLWLNKHRASITPAQECNGSLQPTHFTSISSAHSVAVGHYVPPTSEQMYKDMPRVQVTMENNSLETDQRGFNSYQNTHLSQFSFGSHGYGTPQHHFQIYIGDHMTRSWTKDGRSTAVSPAKSNLKQDDTDDKKQNSLARPCPNKTPVGSIPVRSQSLRLPNGKRRHAKDILAHCTITEDDLKIWQNSFDDLLKNHAGRHVFRTFLESEIADENLKFWLACEDLKKMTKQKRAEKMAQTIYDTYINVYSPHEVNIDYKMREDIVDQLKYKTDATVFTQAQHQIYTLMHRDSYPRFLSSPLLAELTEEITRRSAKLGHKTKSETSLRRSNIMCCCCRRRESVVVETTEGSRPAPSGESAPPAAMEMSRVAQSDKLSVASSDGEDEENNADDAAAASDTKRSSGVKSKESDPATAEEGP